MIELDNDSILNGIEKDGYFLYDIEGSANIYKAARTEYEIACRTRKVYSSTNKFKLSDLERRQTITKYAIGPENGSHEPIAQFLITTYLANFASLYPTIYKLSEKLVETRNMLTNVKPDFGTNPEKDQFWNAIRLHHYPIGGGFMQRHIDTGFPAILKKSGVPYLQASCCLSVKGEQYQSGGGYVINKRTHEKVYTDCEKEVIRFIFFDGSVEHGVDVPSKDRELDLDGEKGRVALFTNLYTYKQN